MADGSLCPIVDPPNVAETNAVRYLHEDAVSRRRDIKKALES